MLICKDLASLGNWNFVEKSGPESANAFRYTQFYTLGCESIRSRPKTIFDFNSLRRQGHRPRSWSAQKQSIMPAPLPTAPMEQLS